MVRAVAVDLSGNHGAGVRVVLLAVCAEVYSETAWWGYGAGELIGSLEFGSEIMELLDRYLQAVRFWLPKAQQEDIIAELSSDLRSQIDDREMELGRPLEDAELEVILRRCGSPILVASRYRPQTQLIGPALFPIYQFVWKMALLWILVPLFVLIVGPAMIVSAPDHWGALLQTWSTLWFAM